EDDWQDEDIAELAALLARRRDEIAAVIIEPVVQGAGGMSAWDKDTRIAEAQIKRAWPLWIVEPCDSISLDPGFRCAAYGLCFLSVTRDLRDAIKSVPFDPGPFNRIQVHFFLIQPE
ncbi:MAG: hypothetical protein ACFCUJ_15485, partial [Thiotrichales bacterium]